MTTPSLDLAEYTHEKLIARGYTRHKFSEYPGWVTYVPRPIRHGDSFISSKARPTVGFAGNDATMNNWIEEVSNWKTHFPETYRWWCDPKKRIYFNTQTNEVIIKSEDPLLVEERGKADAVHA